MSAIRTSLSILLGAVLGFAAVHAASPLASDTVDRADQLAAQKAAQDSDIIRSLLVGEFAVQSGDSELAWKAFLNAAQKGRSAEAAGRAFEGTHDFAAVRSVGTQTKTTVRTVHWCRAEKSGDEIRIAVCANGFLYNMVRAIVGTMVYASHGKLEPEEIPALLEKGDRRLTGPTMPPQGLYLNRVWYEGEIGRLMLE